MAEARQAGRRSRPGLLVSVLALAAFAILIALGTWQVERLQWKENLLATISERMQAPPAPLDEIAALVATGGEIEYRPVVVRGRFLHDREQFFFATHSGRTGYFVYTPLERQDGSILLVNRGFVDMDLKDPARRPAGQVEGEVEVVGLAREKLAGKPSSIVPDNDPAKNIFYWKDLDAMAANAGLDPARVLGFFVDADATANPGGYPIGGVTIIDLPNNHLQYAVTWYGLALALAGVFVFRFFGRKPAPEEEGDGSSHP
jgi:Uncharacterized conserved protein